MAQPYPPIHYSDYLKIDDLLNLQKPRSEEFGKSAHDETLFIVIHQVYELWFKQILFELDSALKLFSQSRIDERDMLMATHRLQRIIEIQKILVAQVDVLETMTPLDFLEFRDFLYPASGFQSAQFRLVENKLGLINRLTYNKAEYDKALKDSDVAPVKNAEESPSLFELLEKWLERTPFLSSESFEFWKSYRVAVENRIKDSREKLKESDLESKTIEAHTKSLDIMERSFTGIFDKEVYKKQQEEGQWRLSHEALCAALFIQLYRDEPILQLPFQIITQLQTIDENFTQWRHRHALMVHRMIGAKMGTGGSSGHKYLRAASDRHKVFQDFNNLSTFFIPKSELPELPKELKDQLNFRY